MYSEIKRSENESNVIVKTSQADPDLIIGSVESKSAGSEPAQTEPAGSEPGESGPTQTETQWQIPKQQEKREKKYERKLAQYKRDMIRKEYDAQRRTVETKQQRQQRQRKARELQKEQVLSRQLLKQEKDQLKKRSAGDDDGNRSNQEVDVLTSLKPVSSMLSSSLNSARKSLPLPLMEDLSVYDSLEFEVIEPAISDDSLTTPTSRSLFSPSCPFSPTFSSNSCQVISPSLPSFDLPNAPSAAPLFTPLCLPEESEQQFAAVVHAPLRQLVARQPLEFEYDAMPRPPKKPTKPHPPTHPAQPPIANSAFNRVGPLSLSQTTQPTPVLLVHECPVTLDPVVEPVIARDGHTYERHFLDDLTLQCKTQGKPLRSPMTGEEMASGYFPNHVLNPQPAYQHTTGGW